LPPFPCTLPDVDCPDETNRVFVDVYEAVLGKPPHKFIAVPNLLLKESEEKYRSLFESSKDPLFVTTKQGKFVDLNEAMVQLLGYGSKEELMKIEVAQTYFNPQVGANFRRSWQDRNFVKDLELALKRKDGSKIDALLTVTTRTNREGNIIGMFGITRNITKRKTYEQHILDMLSIATHDIRNPLASMGMTIKLLSRGSFGPVDDSVKATLEELSEADLLLHVVDASDPNLERKMDAVGRVLADLDLTSLHG
jgi:PAS domain S-box-containing protein